MEQDELTVDPQYLKGFNSGYLLAQYEPELAAKLTAHSNEQSEFFKGLVGGTKEYDRETHEWAKSFSKGAPAKDERDQHKER